MAQTCVVHLIRASIRFVSCADRKKVAALRPVVYTAPDAEAAWSALEDFASSDLGAKYPRRRRPGRGPGSGSRPSWSSPPALRRVIYATNAIESLNYQLRKVTKNRSHFPSDDAAVKLLRLAICDIEDKRAHQRAEEAGKTAKDRRARR